MVDLGEVFISYSWDSEEHIKSVLALSNRLRSDGIDCVLDQYEVSPPEGWPRWMDRKITSASLVITVCTENYNNRVMGKEAPDKGHGVKWEGNLIYQHLYNSGADNTKFVPVLLRVTDRAFIPTPLQGASFFVVDTDDGYEKLYARLLGKPPVEKPPLGQRRAAPKKEVKTDIAAAYLMAPINIPLWDKAQWFATAFGMSHSEPPIMGITFTNKDAAAKIFEEWQHRYGSEDKYEELRISIVEGDIPGEDAGYTVHIGVDVINTVRRYRDAGLEVDNDSFFATISRLNRMHPKPDSPYLSEFKKAYRKFGEYLLVPAVSKPDGSGIQWVRTVGIRKRVIHFRNISEIKNNENDDDFMVLGKYKKR
jgi:hypothetical protein